jgi:ADP-sugar diphosphatase
MSSFTIPRVDGADSLPVSSPADLSRDALLAFPAFSVWLSTLQRSLARQHRDSHEFHRSPFVLRRIDIQAADFFKGGRLGFLKLKADVSNGDGESLPGSVFLRGGSVGMLVCTSVLCFVLV